MDTVTFTKDSYCNKYQLRKTDHVSGEGWEIRKDQKLGHKFLGNIPYNRFIAAGYWRAENNGIVFYVKNKKLIKKGYPEKESFKPISISWELHTDWKNSEDQQKKLVFINTITILNKEDISPVLLFEELKEKIGTRFLELKDELASDDPFYFAELNEKVINEFTGLLYKKNLFSSVETLKEYR